MKKTAYLFLFSLLWLSGCKKNEDVIDPNFAASVTGRYPLTYYRERDQSINLPSGDLSGYFETTRIDNTHINLKLSETIGPKASDTTVDDLGTIELINDTGIKGTFNMKVQLVNYNIGTISASEINVKDAATNGMEIEIRAKR